MIAYPGCATLVTHVFVSGDPYLSSDAVFGVKDSLVVDFTAHPAGPTPDGGRLDRPFSTVGYDFVLAPA
jgi:hydroxyquinol 1,2-dioxygenase